MKKNTVTQAHIQAIMEATHFNCKTELDKCTVVSAELPNGFIIVESSACVDPANYDFELGLSICKKRIEDKVWALEGYVLQSLLSVAPLPSPGTFGWALERLKAGAKVARSGWNGKGMHVEFVLAAKFGYKTQVDNFFIIKTVNGNFNTWVPSVSDCLAEDWEECEV